VNNFKPKITIIIATYNSEKTLEQTLASVAGQIYSNIELIVIDGGSTDLTVDIIRKYENIISYWETEPDEGVYDAFNKGVKHATGEYVQFLGSDDCLCEATTIEYVVANLSDEIDVLSATVWLVDEKTNLQYLLNNSHAVDKKSFDGRMIPHPGMFVKRELLLKHPFDISYQIAADYLFFLECYFENARFAFIDKPVVFFSSCGISSTNEVKLNEENEKIWRKFHLDLKITEDNMTKHLLKNFLKGIGLFEVARYLINRYLREKWVPHICEWTGCRWCRNRRD
jgi:glycosyltransferase involved in cell wall biosynthesis